MTDCRYNEKLPLMPEGVGGSWNGRSPLFYSFFYYIENGRSQPSLARLKDIAKGLDTSVSFLLEEEICLEEEPSLSGLLIKDFASWPEEDREELLAYLKAKRMARQKKQ